MTSVVVDRWFQPSPSFHKSS